MIDFRYHVVSIVAIFLALTVGLVIGASILSKSVADSLRNDLAQRNDQIKSQQNDINELKTQIDQQNKYITDTADQLVVGRLSGQCVAMVEIAGADSNAYSGVRTMVQKQSGATICSETTINASLTASGSQQTLVTLIQEHTPSGQKLSGTIAQQAVELIGEALTTYQTVGAVAQTANPSATATPKASGSAKASGSPAPTSSASAGATASTGASGGTMTAGQSLGTLKDFQTAGVITMQTQPAAGQQASLAYVQAPSSANTDTGADAVNQAYITLAESLRKGGAGTMVGGSGQSADKGGLVYAVINDSVATREISTVDNTDVTMGQVASVFCLLTASQGTSTVAGHYGTGASNDGPVPPIATLG